MGWNAVVQQPTTYQLYGDLVWNAAQAADTPLYAHQVDAVRHIQEHLQRRAAANRTRKAVAVLPTGTGKSPIALVLPYAMKSKRVLVITPRDTLRSQMYESATNSHEREQDPAFLTKVGLVPVDRPEALGHIIEADSAKKLFDNNASVTMTIANAQIFTDRQGQRRRRWSHLLPPKTYDLVVVDEAHFHPAPTWKAICDHFLTSETGCNVVFLTATPYRQDEDPVCEPDEFCFQFLRSVAVSRHIIRDVAPIRVGFSIAEEKTIDDFEDEDEADAMEQRLKHLCVLRGVQEALNHHDQLFRLPGGRRHKALIMVNGLSKDADQLEIDARQKLPDLHARGFFTGEKVDGGRISKSQLKAIMQTFKRRDDDPELPDDPRVLIVNAMLKEGFDFSSVSVIGISRSFVGDGPSFEQFLGRGVRRFRGGEPEGFTAKFVYHAFDDLEAYFNRYMLDRPVEIVAQ